jgi:hypothetical protein
MAAVAPSKRPGNDENHRADDGDGGVLAVQVGLSAFTNVACNFLHACVALVGGHHRLGRPDGVDNGKQSTGDDSKKN